MQWYRVSEMKHRQSAIINILFLPLVWAFFHIIKVVFSTPLGTLSDRIGRKIVINAGWAIYAFVYLAFALLVFLPPGLQVLATFVLFAIYALFYAFTEGTGKAFVADLVSEEKRGNSIWPLQFFYRTGSIAGKSYFWISLQLFR